MATAPVRFVNLQTSPVGVYTPEKRKVYVQPFRDRKYSTAKTDIFVVEGEHYQKFAASGGPLAPFPDDADVAAVPASPESAPVDPMGTAVADVVVNPEGASSDPAGGPAGAGAGPDGDGAAPAAGATDGDEGGVAAGGVAAGGEDAAPTEPATPVKVPKVPLRLRR